MSFVCPWCNPARNKPTVWRKASRCSANVRSGGGKRRQVRCNGLVCATCGQCQRQWEHTS